MFMIHRRTFLKTLAVLGTVGPRRICAASGEPEAHPYFIDSGAAPEVRAQWQRYQRAVTCPQGQKILRHMALVGAGPDGTAFLIPKQPDREGTTEVQLVVAFHFGFQSAQPGDYRVFTTLGGRSIVYVLARGDPAKQEFWSQEVKNIDYADKKGHPSLSEELGMPDNAHFTVGTDAQQTAVLCYTGLWFEGMVKGRSLVSFTPKSAPRLFTPKFFDCSSVLGEY